MGATYTESQKRACLNYYKKTDLIQVRCPKGKKDKVKAYAASKGMSIGEFINKILDETMND